MCVCARVCVLHVDSYGLLESISDCLEIGSKKRPVAGDGLSWIA